MTKSEISDIIKKQASILGFDACGIAKAGFLSEDENFLKQWLQSKAHGEMGYMENYFDKRLNPQLLVENARSVIVVLLNYFPQKLQNTSAPQLAKYAYGSDYHYIIKSKLNELKEFIAQHAGIVNGTAYCDSAPVLERRWAEKAGLGWVGKNTNLLNSELGSFFFIGELVVDMKLEYDVPQVDRCGSCSRCIDACPTKALTKHRVDASRCISYLTIEKKGEIPEEFQAHLSNCLFGCDICQDVCPWNKKKAHPHHFEELQPSDFLLNMMQEDWEMMTKGLFNALFKKSAVKRAGYNKIMDTLKVIASKDSSD